MKKKLLLSLLGVLIALPAFARDFEYEYEGQTLTYTVLDEEAKTVETKSGYYSSGNKVSGDLVIPAIAKDGEEEYSVIKIGVYAFYNCSGLTSVIIPGSVTSIGSYAFNGCSGLKKSAYPNTLSNPFPSGIYVAYDPTGAIIEDGWIYGPEKSEIRFAPYTLTGDYVIPESVTSIGRSAFNGCSGLTSVTIGNSVETIGDSAFRGCSGLTSVIIPGSVTSIGSSAFYGCSGLISVSIGNSVETIGNSAFYGCSGLTSVIIPGSVTSIGSSAFNGCSGLKKSAYPNTIRSNPFPYGIYVAYNPEGAIIEEGWIYGPEKSEIRFAPYTLTGDYVIPESVETIGDSAFNGCSGLTSVIIPGSVTSIGNYAFYGCSGLTSVIIPDSVTSIGDYAFYECYGLKKSAYPNTIRSNPFPYGIYVAYNPEGAIIEEGWIYGPEKSEIRFAPYTLTGDYVIPGSVTSIGSNAFRGCSGLTSVTIPESVTSIGRSAFNGCSGLTSVTIGNSVETIGDYAFYNCSGLTSVIIPGSVTSIGTDAFKVCNGLKKSAYPNIFRNPFPYGIGVAYNSKEAIIEDGWIYGPEKLEIRFAPYTLTGDYVIPGSVTSIDSYAFRGCRRLTSVIIPDSVTSIGESAFYECSGLTSVTIGDSVTSIGDYAFYGCSDLTSVIIPGSVISIGSYAFNGYSLENVYVNWENPIYLYSSVFSDNTYNTATLNVPVDAVASYTSTNWWSYFKNHAAGGYEVKSYSDDIFSYDLVTDPENQYAVLVKGDYSSMVTANIPERFTDLTDESNPVRYYITAIGNNAFKNCNKLENVSFNSRTIINSLGFSAFEGCTALTTIAIPQTVKKLGDNAFSGSGLTSITMPESIENIGEYAFQNCAKLTSITIPESVKNLSEGIFLNSGLTSVEIPNSIKSIGGSAFSGCKALTSVTIGNSVETIGGSAFRGCSGLTSVIIPGSVTSIGSSAFYGCSGLISVSIGNSVETIGNSAFNGCSGLTSVTIPDSVTEIGGSAFNGCSGLTSVSIGNSVEIIGSSAFNGCNKLTSVTIPDSVTEIGGSAFRGCSGLTSVTIPDSVTEIGGSAFDGCRGLETLSLLDGNEIEFGTSVFSGTNIKTAYIGRPLTTQVIPLSSLETLTIGNTVTEIGASVWKNAAKLSELTLGSSLTSIGEKAFSGCTALTEVVVPPTVETIGASAFAGNTALASIIMGHNVKTIGEKAYDGCPANTVSITAQTPPTAPNNTFSNYTGKLYLQGQDAVDAYYDAFTCWDRFEGYVMIEPTAIKYDGEKALTGKPGDTFQLTATLMPENVTLPQVFWRSTNPEIATVDATGLVTIHADLHQVMTLAEDGEEEEPSRSCKIIAESLYSDGPVLEVTVSDVTTDIEETISESVVAGEIDFNAPLDVYNLNGLRIATSVDNLAPGFYILRQGKSVKKIAVK